MTDRSESIAPLMVRSRKKSSRLTYFQDTPSHDITSPTPSEMTELVKMASEFINTTFNHTTHSVFKSEGL
jgi:hypothetical protein